MPEGTLLPPVVAAPAKLAASSSAESASSNAVSPADGAESGPSFDDVLKAQVTKTDGQGDAAPPSESAGDTAQTAQPTDFATFLMAPDASVLQSAAGALTTHVDVSRAVLQELRQKLEGAGQAQPIGGVSGREKAMVDRIGILPDDNGNGRSGNETQALDFNAIVGAIHEDAEDRRPLGLIATTEVTDSEAGASVAPSNPVQAGVVQTGREVRSGTDAGAVKAAVPTPFSSPQWGDAFSDRVSLLVQSRQPSAELQVNPPNLGPVEIKVSMTGDQASLSFFSPHAPVREAIQAAMPRLTEALAESGLTLGNVFVGAQSQGGQESHQEQRSSGSARQDTVDSVHGVRAQSEVRWSGAVSGLRAVDLFA
ncbi:MAG: flagellar hook-length control protein FliK [Betaproteobacteria bacterium]|nr:flagellar hook-length control protein FliK [Betaproteobacteria bacterium]